MVNGFHVGIPEGDSQVGKESNSEHWHFIALFLEKASRSAVMKYTINSQIYVLTLECGTDRLSLNVGTELPYYSA